MGWKPESERDTRYYLWEEKFMCTLRYGDTFTVDKLKERGIYTSGDPSMDRDMMNTPTRFYLSINQMVEYFRQGIPVGVTKREDTARIYEYISNHIDAFRREISLSFSPEKLPVDDLILLDEFAATVYGFAKHQFNRETANDLIARRMDALMGFTPDNVLGEETRPVAPVEATGEEEEHDGFPERTSLRDFFVDFARRQNRGF